MDGLSLAVRKALIKRNLIKGLQKPTYIMKRFLD